MPVLKLIRITSPMDDQVVSNAFSVHGVGTAFEGLISLRLVDDNGRTLGQGQAIGGAAGIPSPFHTLLTLVQLPETDEGTLEAYETSAKDGTEMHMAKVRVRFDRRMVI